MNSFDANAVRVNTLATPAADGQDIAGLERRQPAIRAVRQPATLAAVANLKGGVGKSTTTVMLADGLAYFYGMSVLVIDLDPQANSSQMLLTERGVQAASDQGKGAHHLLAEFMAGRPASAAPFIMPNAVSLEELRIAEEQDEREGWISILPLAAAAMSRK